MNARKIMWGVISKADGGDFDAEGEENPGGSNVERGRSIKGEKK